MRHVLSSLSNVDGAATDSDPAPPDVVPFEPVLTSASNGWLRLNWDGVRVDAEPLFDSARSHASAIESLPIERLEQGAVIDVASLFGDCDHGYVGAIRHELRAAHTESCTRLAHAALQSGDNMIAVHWARQGLSADPYREDRHQIAIRGLDRAGRPGEAGEQFATCRRLLIEDLGVEPLPATVEAATARRPEPSGPARNRGRFRRGPHLDHRERGVATSQRGRVLPTRADGGPLRGNRPAPFANSGLMAGLSARTDSARGVWKAPAGIDARLRGVEGLEYELSDPENGVLNPLGLNSLRSFPVFGPVSWGARTMVGADELTSEWKYVPVRRLTLFIEESLYRGTQFVVFEPNDEPLWGEIRLAVGSFMHRTRRTSCSATRRPRRRPTSTSGS